MRWCAWPAARVSRGWTPGLVGWIVGICAALMASVVLADSHTFVFAPPAGQSVDKAYVAGDFNAWSTTATPMKRVGDHFEASADLTPGVHYYKFVVDGKWMNDPTADKSLEADDGNGGMNSGVKIGGDAEKSPEPAPSPAGEQHKFVFTPPAGQSVDKAYVAGDFNGWSTTATPMKRDGDHFEASADLTPGVHYYKFVVDGKWMNDPTADKSLEADDGNGGMNSGVKIGGDAEQAPEPALAPAGEQHKFIFNPPAGQSVDKAYVAGDFNGWSTTATPMKRVGDHFEAAVALMPGVHYYKFVVDGKWMNDPTADKSLEADDGNGGKNSGVKIDAPVSKADNEQSDAAPAADAQGADAEYHHRFVYVPPRGRAVHAVFVAGDFNGWSTDATPMLRVGNRFEATVDLDEGLHYYKFVVDGRWINDPRADKSLEADDDNGGMNSGLLVGPDLSKAPPPEAGNIHWQYVLHNPTLVADCNAPGGDTLRLRLRFQANALTAVRVHLGHAGLDDWPAFVLDKMGSAKGVDTFGGLVQVPEAAIANGNQVRYYFELQDSKQTVIWIGGKKYDEPAAAEAAAQPVSLEPTFQTPDWAKHAIWYQIFPERFRNGDPANDPPRTVRWTSDWYKEQPGESGAFYSMIYGRRYGGDLQGVEQELPYLRSLGVNAIYLNPIFQAESLHKYDASDYRHIDEHFGYAGDIEQLHGETDNPSTWQWTKSDKLFLQLVADAHRQGFHVIVDGVFNHVGTHFWAFQDVIRNGRRSKYADWFDITNWTPEVNRQGEPIPFHYRAWDGDDGSLPIFKKDATIGIVHGPREHILAIARRWLAPDGDASRGIDGFRLDAPQNVPHPFWIDFRKVVKQTKPDAYIDGEIWSWAQPWLRGDQFDAVMNYQFAIPAQQFFVDQRKAISPSTFNSDLSALEFNYPLQVSLVNQNLLDSHDTDRVASMFANPDLGFNARARIQDNNPDYNPAKPTASERQRMLQEVALQMTFLGAPMIYYGDEAGMWGPADPSDRQPMIWKNLGTYDNPEERFDQGKFDWYQRLIAIRRALPALQTGFFHPVEIDDAHSTYAFVRTLGKQQVFVAISRSAQPQRMTVPLYPGASDQKWVNWLDPAEVEIDGTRADVLNAIDARPTAVIRPDQTTHIHNGHVHLNLPAWGTAILSTTDASASAAEH